MDEMNRGMSFEWDATIEHDGAEFITLPKGVYPFEVTRFERSRHEGSAKLPPCNKAMLTIKVEGGELGDAYTQHNLFLHSITEGLLCEFFTAIGARKHGERLQMDWSKVVGARGWCEVFVNEYEKNGELRTNNKISKFLSPENAPKPGTMATAPATASAWTSGKF